MLYSYQHVATGIAAGLTPEHAFHAAAGEGVLAICTSTRRGSCTSPALAAELPDALRGSVHESVQAQPRSAGHRAGCQPVYDSDSQRLARPLLTVDELLSALAISIYT